MSLEDQYDAWVRGLMGGGKYAATPKQAEDANDAVQQMQAQLDALTEAQKRQTAAGSALNAVQKAGAATAESVRRMSSELTKSLKQDGLLGGTVAAPSPAPAVPAKADFAGVTEKIKAQVLGQDAFVSALVKAFRRPFVLGTADDTAHARSVMLLCGPNGTGRHYALQCVVDELAARGVLHSAAVETLDLALYPGPAQEKLFLQDLYAALQSDAEVLTFEHYESCAANYLNMLATLAMDGTLALSSRYVLQRGILVDVGTALAPGAIGELQAGGKYFVFYSNKGETALADHFGAKFVDAVAGDIYRTEAFTPEALAAVAARELNYLAQRTRRQCGLALTMGADVRDLLASQYGKTSGMQAMRDYCETVYRAIAEYVLDADETPTDGTPAALTAEDLEIVKDQYELLARDMLRREKEGKPITFYHYMLDLTGGPCIYKRISGCGSGTEYMAVTPWGDLYPCHQFVGEEAYKLGDIWNGVTNTALREEFRSCNAYARPECNDCWARFYCSGGCAANAFHATGSIRGVYEAGCELFRKRIECAIMMKVAEDSAKANG